MASQIQYEDVRSFLDELFEGDIHAKRVQSLAGATLGVVTSGALAVHAIGQGLAFARDRIAKHAVKQVDRLLSNQGVDVWGYFGYWVPYVVGERDEIVVALDWTSFARDGHETIALSLVSGGGRATPLLWQTVKASQLKGKQTDYEDGLLVRLGEVLPVGVGVTVVADRGFADCKLFRFLAEELGFGYVIRLRGQYYVTSAEGERRKAAKWVGKGGRARTLRNARVTDSQGYEAPTVVCVRDKAMEEPWCLVASDPTATPRQLTRYYAQRWGIETSFRDIKDARYGFGLSATRIASTQRRDRLLLLAAFALVLLSLLGAAGEALGYDRMLKANTVKKRTHSLLRQGCMLYEWMPNMRESLLTPLLETFTEMLLEQRAFRQVFGSA